MTEYSYGIIGEDSSGGSFFAIEKIFSRSELPCDLPNSFGWVSSFLPLAYGVLELPLPEHTFELEPVG